jgi:DNA-binding transcriptional MocR family regulator
MRGMFQPISGKPQPGMGVLPSEWIATDAVLGGLRKVMGTASVRESSVRYGEPMGEPALRRVLAARLQAMGIAARAEHIVTTMGATHALDIVSRTLLKPGDAVMVEEPGWAVEFARLSALGMRILPVPRGPEGPTWR